MAASRDLGLPAPSASGLAAHVSDAKVRAALIRSLPELTATEGRPNVRLAEHPDSSPYQQGLDKNPANYVPLTPLSFLERTADVFPRRTAVIHGPWRADYAELRARSRRLASALERRGVRPGDTVAVDAAERAGDGRCPLRHPDGRRRDQRAERAPGARYHRLHPGPRRSQGAADRPRVFGRDQGRARAERSASRWWSTCRTRCSRCRASAWAS